MSYIECWEAGTVAKKVTEEAVKKSVSRWLESQEFKVTIFSKKRGRPAKKKERGRKMLAPTQPDIKARKGTRYYYIEAKGDPASSNALYTVIGQIVTKMAAKTPIDYAIALSPSYKKYIHLFPPESQRKLKVKVLMPQPERERRLPDVTEIPS